MFLYVIKILIPNRIFNRMFKRKPNFNTSNHNIPQKIRPTLYIRLNKGTNRTHQVSAPNKATGNILVPNIDYDFSIE